MLTATNSLGANASVSFRVIVVVVASSYDSGSSLGCVNAGATYTCTLTPRLNGRIVFVVSPMLFPLSCFPLLWSGGLQLNSFHHFLLWLCCD